MLLSPVHVFFFLDLGDVNSVGLRNKTVHAVEIIGSLGLHTVTLLLRLLRFRLLATSEQLDIAKVFLALHLQVFGDGVTHLLPRCLPFLVEDLVVSLTLVGDAVSVKEAFAVVRLRLQLLNRHSDSSGFGYLDKLSSIASSCGVNSLESHVTFLSRVKPILAVYTLLLLFSHLLNRLRLDCLGLRFLLFFEDAEALGIQILDHEQGLNLQSAPSALKENAFEESPHYHQRVIDDYDGVHNDIEEENADHDIREIPTSLVANMLRVQQKEHAADVNDYFVKDVLEVDDAIFPLELSQGKREHHKCAKHDNDDTNVHSCLQEDYD